MTTQQEQLLKRLQSFFWRLGAAVLAFSVGWALENLEILELSPMTTMVVALILGEVSKYLNRK